MRLFVNNRSLGFAIAVGALILISSLYVTYRNNQDLLESNHWIEHTHEVIDEAHLLAMEFQGVQVNSRVYLVTKDSTYLENVDDIRKSIDLRLSRLRLLVSDNPPQVQRVDSLQGLYLRRISAGKLGAFAWLPGNEFREKMMQTFRASKELEDDFIARVAAFRAVEEGLLRLRKDIGDENLRDLRELFVFQMILVAALAVVTLLSVRHSQGLRQKVIDHNAKLQAALNETSAYRYALNESALVSITDKHGKITHVNDMFCVISQYSRDELLGVDHRIINSSYHPRDYIKHLWDTIRTGKVWRGELRNRAKDGSIYWVDSSIVPFIDDQGKPYQYVSIRSDITEKKSAEEVRVHNLALELEIKKRKAELADVLERITDGFIVLDREFRYQYANSRIAAMTGKTVESLLGQRVWDVFPDAVGSETYHAFNRAVSEQKDIDHLDYYAPLDLWQENYIYPSHDGLSVFIRDVTAQKRAEQKLINSERVYKAIASNIPGSVICLMDKDYRYTLIEGDMVEKLGYSRNLLLGNRMEDAISQERLEETKPYVDRAFQGEPCSVELKRGEYDLLLRYVPLDEADGQVKTIMIVSIDVTDLKKAQREIVSLNESLEHKILERTEQLAMANKELESFSYSVAHDLRTPLRAVNGYASMFMEDYQSRIDEEGQRYLNAMHYNVNRMGRLIDDLLAFSKLGRKEIVKSMVNMRELTNDVVSELGAGSTSISVGDLHPVAADPSLIKHVLVNLISNGIKYTSKKADGCVDISSQLSGNDITYTFADNGVGFDMRYADKLFGVFQRLHSNDDFEGTGVGLAIVQRIVHRHDGRVWAEAQVDVGATFRFTLPVRNVDSQS